MRSISSRTQFTGSSVFPDTAALIRTVALFAAALLLPLSLCGQRAASTHHPPPATKPAPAAHFLVLLDPGHGGADSGTSLSANATEKSAALAFALRLRDALTAQGIEVRLTRDSDANLSPDQRGETSASLLPAACLSLHLTAASAGVHIFTAVPAPPEATGFTPWTQAQAGYLHQSRALASTLQASLKSSSLPAFLAPASLPALERMHCPAVAVEFAPAASDSPALINSLVEGLRSWRAQWTRMRATP